MRVTTSLKYFGCVLLLGFGFGVASFLSSATETLESSVLRIELSTSPYSYRAIERSSGEVLVSESGGNLLQGEPVYRQGRNGWTKANG